MAGKNASAVAVSSPIQGKTFMQKMKEQKALVF